MRYLILFGLALAGAAIAQEPPADRTFAWQTNGERAAPDPSRASKDGFGVSVFVTPDIEGVWKAWGGPTPPNISVTDQIERGKPVHAMIVFNGCKAAADGNCNVTGIYSITSPDGTAYGEPHGGKIWAGPPAPGYNLQLSEGSLGLVVEPDEPLGRYMLKASVTDHVAGITLDVEAPVEAVEADAKSAR